MPRYAQILNTLPGVHIKNAMQPFLDKCGVRKDLVLVETPNLRFCTALGMNTSKKGMATILITPHFYEADKDACTFIIKHEISHIKNNDNFTVPCVQSICQLAASLFGMNYLSFFPAIGLTVTVSMISSALFSQRREAKADDFAIENSSSEELKGGRRFFIALKEIENKKPHTFLKSITHSPNGDNRMDILHPSITSRIQKIERNLQARNIDIDISVERNKINQLKSYIISVNLEMDKIFKEQGGFLTLLKAQFPGY